METIDVTVVGGGVAGLAAAAAVAATGASVCLIEQHPRFGAETSTHNSGVIHAGLYYPPGSLKARLCVEGARQLYAFCATHQVPHERCGKLVVATDEADVTRLDALCQQGLTNGADGVRVVGRETIRQREPHVVGVAALFSPNTGIVEPERLVRALVRHCEHADVIALPGTPLLGARATETGVVLRTPGEEFLTRAVVNAAGLHADRVSALLGGEPYDVFPCRGEYAELTPARVGWVRGLVYPLPNASGHGLGVHLTRTTHGSVLIGPTVRQGVAPDDYETDRLPLEAFLEPARRLLPALTLQDLQPGGSGIRANPNPPDVPFADWIIRRDVRNARVVQAGGINSPGLTSCLAIGGLVSELVTRILDDEPAGSA